MPAVTFNNTQNVGFIIANTAAPRRNLDVAIPPGDVGDAIVVIATGNTGSQLTSMNVPGYSSFVTVSGTPSSGELSIFYRISNGRETNLSVKTDSSTTDASFCVAVLRFKGTHRIVPLMAPAGSGSSPNTAVDGVQISTGDPVTKPVGDNSILVSVLCGANTEGAFLEGEQPAGQTLITRANTANSRLMISYQNKPRTNNYTTLAFANTVGRRRALTFSVIPDTAAAGVLESYWGGGIAINRTSSHYLQFDPRVSILAKKDEEIGEVGYRLVSSSIGDGSGFEIGVYDVTNGYANAKLAGAQTVNTITQTPPTGFVQTFYPPIKLVPGRRYSTAFRTNSATNISLGTSYLGNQAMRFSSQNGSVALPASWDFDSGSTSGDNWYNVYAPVRNSRKAHVSSYKFFSNTASQAGTAHTGTFPLYPGASRKIIVMAYSEIVAVGAMTAATFDGQNMSLIATDTLDDPNYFSMWYYDIPDSGVLQDFTTYTEFDPLNDLSLTGTNQINIDTLASVNPGQTGYRLDLGASGKPGNFRYRIGPVNISAASSSVSRFSIFTFSETVSNQQGLEPKSLHVRWVKTTSTSNSTLQLAHFATAGAQTTSPTASVDYTGPEVYLNTDFYVDISRIGSNAFCSIYTDNAYKNLITTLSVPLSDSIAYRYVYFGSVWSTGTNATVTATIKNAYYMVGEPGNKSITVTTTQPTGNVSWHAWQLNRANTGMPRSKLSGEVAGSLAISNTIFATADSFVLATVASSATNGTYTWNYDVINDRQELDEAQYTTATADAFQYTEGTKTITATASATDGNKYLGIVCVDTVKSKNKIKSGFVG